MPRPRCKDKFAYYLYGLTFLPHGVNPDHSCLRGIEGYPVRFLTIKDISVVYSKVPPEDYSRDSLEARLNNLNWLENRAHEHYQVQEAIMARTGTALPFKFCTIFTTKKRMAEYVTDSYEGIENILTKLKGKQEWSVKVFVNKERLKAGIAQLNPHFRSFLKTQQESTGKNFLLGKKLLHDIEAEAAEYYRQQTTNLINNLRQACEEWRQNETFPFPEKKGEEMVGNFAFLVNADHLQNFTSLMDAFNERQPRDSLYAVYTGPWLPYNFVGELGVDSCGRS